MSRTRHACRLVLIRRAWTDTASGCYCERGEQGSPRRRRRYALTLPRRAMTDRFSIQSTERSTPPQDQVSSLVSPISPSSLSPYSSSLDAECRFLNGAQTGESKITAGHALPAKHIIHTVGPIYSRNKKLECERLLRACYETTLQLAVNNGCKSLVSLFTTSRGDGTDRRDLVGILGHLDGNVSRVRSAIDRGDTDESILQLWIPTGGCLASRSRHHQDFPFDSCWRQRTSPISPSLTSATDTRSL